MSFLKDIYIKSPKFIQNLGLSIYGEYLNHQRFGKVYQSELESLSKIDYTNLDSQKDIQNQKFMGFLSFSVMNSPFYKEFYKDIDIKGISSIKDLEKLPILEKEMVRSNIKSFYTLSASKGIKMFTGGTTGKSLEVIFTKSDMQKRYAYLNAWENSHGINMSMKRATFSGRQLLNKKGNQKEFWRYNKARHQMLYSTFDMSRDNMATYINSLNKFQPDVINGFVSAIYDLALYIKESKSELLFTPKVIFTTSETLLPYQRNEIESVFSCHVRNQYGSSEGAPFITECTAGKLHYNLDTGIIEEFKTEYGTEMLITSFTTHGTPLIRYRIGDMWELSNEKCSCGLCHPVVKYIEGRQVDFLYASDGTKVSLSHLADVIKGFPNSIINMQFWQEELNLIEILLVVDKNLYRKETDEKNIVKQMQYRFGNKSKINFKYVDVISKEKSGKYALIKNKLLKTNKK